ncbi:hypothetical protein M0804_001207 [Polistes exclamans]|nr:hypothetical protein M0804_001207 [Polistes exclamans]
MKEKKRKKRNEGVEGGRDKGRGGGRGEMKEKEIEDGGGGVIRVRCRWGRVVEDRRRWRVVGGVEGLVGGWLGVGGCRCALAVGERAVTPFSTKFSDGRVEQREASASSSLSLWHIIEKSKGNQPKNCENRTWVGG